MYADYEYYLDGFLMGKSPAVPEDVFRFWEKQAGTVIDKHTFGRLTVHPEWISEPVKDCACELTELLYQADSVSQQTLDQGAAGPLASYSNDGESAAFDLAQSIWTQEGKAKKAREIIYRYLGNTGLLYAGL